MSKQNVQDMLSVSSEITIGDNVYKIKSITLNGIAEFQEWCDEKRVKKALDIYELAGKEIDMDYIMTLKGDQDFYDDEMQKIKGMIHLIYIVLKNNNDNVDEDYVKTNLALDKLEDFAGKVLADFQMETVEGKKTGKNQIAKSPSKK
jgi:hypothetical protein